MRTLILALSLAAIAAADTVVCKDKRRIEGKIIEETEALVKVQVKNGAVTIPRYQIQEVIHGATTEEVYEERRARVDISDPAALLDLAAWCDKNHLAKQAAAEYARVLASGPDPGPEPAKEIADAEPAGTKARRDIFLKAHAALKHEIYEGHWLSFEDYCKARGLVQFDGNWMSPAEAKLKSALKERKELEKALSDKVRECLRKLASGDIDTRTEARDQLDAIPADLKFDPLLENVENRTAEIRAYCIGALSTYNRPEILPRIARRVLVDESEALRNISLDVLKKLNHPDTWAHLQKGLQSESSFIRIRAANALCDFPNEAAAEALLNALQKAAAPKGGFTFGTTETDPRLAGGTKMTDDARRALEGAGKVPGKTNGGMNALEDPEDKSRKEQADKEKAAYARALEKCTGLAYGENLGMWKEWWLQKHAATAAKGEMGGTEKPEPVDKPPSK
ncbi:MAG: HEAT repeat domain-containing protein [Planctomycetes bacterium]|nr:HEAT repeat domain-containing protein [Planctomycetota bacterium]